MLLISSALFIYFRCVCVFVVPFGCALAFQLSHTHSFTTTSLFQRTFARVLRPFRIFLRTRCSLLSLSLSLVTIRFQMFFFCFALSKLASQNFICLGSMSSCWASTALKTLDVDEALYLTFKMHSANSFAFHKNISFDFSAFQIHLYVFCWKLPIAIYF